MVKPPWDRPCTQRERIGANEWKRDSIEENNSASIFACIPARPRPACVPPMPFRHVSGIEWGKPVIYTLHLESSRRRACKACAIKEYIKVLYFPLPPIHCTSPCPLYSHGAMLKPPWYRPCIQRQRIGAVGWVGVSIEENSSRNIFALIAARPRTCCMPTMPFRHVSRI